MPDGASKFTRAGKITLPAHVDVFLHGLGQEPPFTHDHSWSLLNLLQLHS